MPKFVGVAHSLHGHPGAATLHKILRDVYYRIHLQLACRTISKKCLHCLGEYSPRMFRCRFGQLLHGHHRNAVIHMDFLYIQPHDYLLVVRDDFSGKTEFFQCTRATAQIVPESILWWRTRYGLLPNTVFVTDGGSHFANSLVRLWVTQLNLQHHFTLAYSPCVQFFLNNTPHTRLGGRTSDHVFLGMSNNLQLDMPAPDGREFHLYAVRADIQHVVAQFEILHAALDEMHEDVADIQTADCEQFSKQQAERKHIEDIQFEIGDWVLVSRLTRKQHKLQL